MATDIARSSWIRLAAGVVVALCSLTPSAPLFAQCCPTGPGPGFPYVSNCSFQISGAGGTASVLSANTSSTVTVTVKDNQIPPQPVVDIEVWLWFDDAFGTAQQMYTTQPDGHAVICSDTPLPECSGPLAAYDYIEADTDASGTATFHPRFTGYGTLFIGAVAVCCQCGNVNYFQFGTPMSRSTDLNHDGATGSADMTMITNCMSQPGGCTDLAQYDLTNDGVVNVADQSLCRTWGPSSTLCHP